MDFEPRCIWKTRPIHLKGCIRHFDKSINCTIKTQWVFHIWEHSFFHSKIILSSSLLLWLKKLKCDAERPSISARKSSRNSIMDIKWNTIWYLIIKLWFWNRMKLHIKGTRYNSIIFISCFFQQQTLRNDY